MEQLTSRISAPLLPYSLVSEARATHLKPPWAGTSVAIRKLDWQLVTVSARYAPIVKFSHDFSPNLPLATRWSNYDPSFLMLLLVAQDRCRQLNR